MCSYPPATYANRFLPDTLHRALSKTLASWLCPSNNKLWRTVQDFVCSVSFFVLPLWHDICMGAYFDTLHVVLPSSRMEYTLGTAKYYVGNKYT